ncbi:MAG: hypothetical protein Q8O51_01355 [bacterium]|nr:hypothetical protein [bacterium]
MNRTQRYAFIGIILLAVALRFVELHGVPYGVNQDEADRGFEAYSLLKTGHDQHGNRWPLTLEAFSKQRDNASAISAYAALPTVALLGPTLFAVRLPSAFAGTIAVIVTMLLGYQLSKRWAVGLLAGFFLAVSPWHLTLSRVGHEVVWAPTLFLLGLLGWVMSFRKPYYLLLASISWAACLYAYPIAKLFIPTAVLLLISLSWRTFRTHWRWIIGAVILGGILLVPLIKLQLSHFTDAGRLQQILIFTNTQGGPWWQQLLGNIGLYLNPWTWLQGHVSVGPLDVASALVGLTLFFWLVRPTIESSRPRVLFGALLLLAILPAVFMNDNPHQLRVAFLLGPFQLAAAWGFVLAWGQLRSRWRTAVVRVALSTSGVILASVGVWFFWQPGYIGGHYVSFIFTPEIEQVVHLVNTRYSNYADVRFVDFGTSQPYIFFAFFTPWNPSHFQQGHVFIQSAEDENWYRTTKLGRVTFCKRGACDGDERRVLYIALAPYTTVGTKELERIPWRGFPGLAWRIATN